MVDEKKVCPICNSQEFIFSEQWNNLRCSQCNSAPRQRRVHWILNEYIPNWPNLRVHEFAPFRDWISSKTDLYSSSQYFPEKEPGEMVGGFRNENIESLTFENESIDLYVVEDLFEHLFDPEKAIAELIRTLKPNGLILGTVPLEGWGKKTLTRAKLNEQGGVVFLEEQRFHGAPAGSKSSLVVWDYGDDFETVFSGWVGNHKIEFFKGAMPMYEVNKDRRSTFLVRKHSMLEGLIARLQNY